MTKGLRSSTGQLSLMFSKKKKTRETKVSEVPEIVNSSIAEFDGNIKKAKILCSVWQLGENGARDKFIGSQKKKIGDKTFVVKGKRYFINYNEIKEGKNIFYYDCDVHNSVGALSFHDVSKQKVEPNQADMMLIDGVVKVLMGKGGIPAMYLLVAFIAVAIAMASTMYLFSQYQSNGTTIEKQRVSIENLKAENEIFKQRLTENGLPIEVVIPK